MLKWVVIVISVIMGVGFFRYGSDNPNVKKNEKKEESSSKDSLENKKQEGSAKKLGDKL